MKQRGYQYWIWPLAGTIFCLWYIYAATYDGIYSDYVRLVNSYLPDVFDPGKFFVPDVLTRVPANYLGRMINVPCFGYSLTFDRVLGVLGLGLSGAALGIYCREKKTGGIWMAALMVVLFGLNKWEMLTNGSGWTHFVAFAGFYYHYVVFDRIWRGEEKKGDRTRCVLLPFINTLLFAGPYCAIYSVVMILAGAAFWLRDRKKEGKAPGWGLMAGASVLLPLLLYLWSNSYAVEDHAAAADGPFVGQFLETPGFFLRFLLKSFSSMAVGLERAEAVFKTNTPYYVLGFLVIAIYLFSLWLNWRFRLYEETLLPLVLIVSGGLNHVLILASRWIFLNENYGASSRYALQFQAGILGIILTMALAFRKTGNGRGIVKRAKLVRVLAAASCLFFLAGNCYTSYHEIRKAPHRKERFKERAELALDFESLTDDELRENFEYRLSRPDSGQKVREALTILKENHLNVFREDKISGEISTE